MKLYSFCVWKYQYDKDWPYPNLGFPSTGLILGLRPASERRRYIVTTFLIG